MSHNRNPKGRNQHGAIRVYFVHETIPLVLPQFGSGPKFEPEPFRTGPKFSSKFDGLAELNRKFSPGFKQAKNYLNLFEPVRTGKLL
jgi:hypothetical protein